MPDSNDTIEQPGAVLAAAAVGTAAVIVFALLPVVGGAMADRFELNDVQIGLISTVYFSAYALVALSSALWIRRFDWVITVRLGYAGMLAGLLVCVVTQSFQVAAWGFAVVGFSAGLLFPVSLALISDMTQTERNYALKLAAEQLVPAAVLFLLSSSLLAGYDMRTLLIAIVVVIVACGVASIRLPRQGRPNVHSHSSQSGGLLLALLSLFALGINFAGFAGLWAFLERIAVESSLTASFTNLWLGVGLITSGVGPLIAAAVGDRWGRIWPLGLATAIALGSLALLAEPVDKFEYALVLAVLPLGYYFAIAFMYGTVAEADHNGRMSGLMSFALAVGAATGPALFGILKANGGPVVLMMACLIACGALVAIAVERKIVSFGR